LLDICCRKLTDAQFLILTLFISATSVAAQGKLISIANGLKRVTSTSEISCVRQSSRPKVVVPMVLEVGDKLINDSANLTVKVGCGKAVVTLTGPFRVRLIEMKEGHCFLGYASTKAGHLNVKATGPTTVTTGSVKLESSQTQYGITINRVLSGSANREWLVYEGSVKVSGPEFSRTVDEKTKLITVKTGSVRTTNITPKDFSDAAAAYARADLAEVELPRERVRENYETIKELYRGTLVDPKNKEKQQELLHELLHLGISSGLEDAPDRSFQAKPWDVTLQEGEKSVRSFLVRSISCRNPHRFTVGLSNLPFVRILSPTDQVIKVGEDLQVRLEFDATDLKPGLYQGLTLTPCLDCATDCPNWNASGLVNVTVVPRKN
jgi:hypothetical protein